MFHSVSSYDVSNTYKQEGRGDENRGGDDAALQKSQTTCIVEKKRGFKPSDRHNPQKKQFLIELSNQIWQKNQQTSEGLAKRIDLDKIFTPATDGVEIQPKSRKLYASSAFYSPVLHPTVEDQVELARRISRSLSDVTNEKSKGQCMYDNRKKRAEKWVHEGYGQESQQTSKPLQVPSTYTDEAKSHIVHQEKVPKEYSQPVLQVEKTKAWETSSNGTSQTSLYKTNTVNYQSVEPRPYVDANYYDDNENKTVEQSTVFTPLSPLLLKRTSPIPSTINNPRRYLAYKPRIPQGWKASKVSLPEHLYMPKDVATKCYAPPPSPPPRILYESKMPVNVTPIQTSSKPTIKFEIEKRSSDSYPIFNPPSIGQTIPHITFNPSPLAYDKLAKFNNPPPVQTEQRCHYKSGGFPIFKNDAHKRITFDPDMPFTDF